jgi:hypothetical protein
MDPAGKTSRGDGKDQGRRGRGSTGNRRSDGSIRGNDSSICHCRDREGEEITSTASRTKSTNSHRRKERPQEGCQWKQEGHHGSKDQKSDHQGEGRVE